MKMLWITSVIHFCSLHWNPFFLAYVHSWIDVRDFVSDSTPHTWSAPTSVDPTSVDAPYSSYAANSEGTTTLSAPGVYENALNHLGKIYLRRNWNIINFFTLGKSFCADTTAHTWKPTADVDPTSVDAPYSSYAANTVQLSGNSGSNVVSLSGCAATKTCPGVYENALNDLGSDDTMFMLWFEWFLSADSVSEADTSPHSWKPPVDVDPSSFDQPYANYSAVGTTQLSYDGTCNSMPGWNPSFNPSTDIGCRVRALWRFFPV
jgi:hypothetical protein